MVNSMTTEQLERMDRKEAVARFREIQAEIAEALKDLTEEEYETLINELTDEVNAALADIVRRSRGEID
jgi:hypothetical protein